MLHYALMLREHFVWLRLLHADLLIVWTWCLVALGLWLSTWLSWLEGELAGQTRLRWLLRQQLLTLLVNLLRHIALPTIRLIGARLLERITGGGGAIDTLLLKLRQELDLADLVMLLGLQP